MALPGVPEPGPAAAELAVAGGVGLGEASVGVMPRVAVATAPATTNTTDTTEAAAPDEGEAAAGERALGRRLVGPLVAATVMNVVLAVGDRLPAVDGLAYFEAGRNLLGGHGYTRHGAPELHFPPLVPACLRLLELATGSEMGALGAWNVITSVAVVLALVGLAHRLWRDNAVTVAAAWLGGTVAGLGPLFFRHGSGSEGASLALLLWAVLLTLRGLDERSSARVQVRAAWLAGAGLMVGLAYLARPEALLPGVVVGAATVLWTWQRTPERGLAQRARGWLRGGVPVVAAFGVGVLVLLAPYAVYLHGNTGKWSLTAKTQDVSIEAWRAVAEGNRRERDEYLYALNPDGTLGADTRPLTALALDDPAAWVGIVAVNAMEIVRLYAEPVWGYGLAWKLVPLPLVGLAVYEMWRLRRHRGAQVLAGVALVPLATCLAFFTLPRYLTLPTAILVLLGAKGLVRAQRALPRRAAFGLVAAVAVLVAMSALTEARSFLPGGNTADPLDQRAAGRWIEDHTPTDARVMTRSFHVQAYAHRPVVAMPVADLPATLGFAREMGVRYLVLDSRSPLYGTLREGPPPPGLRPVVAIGRSTKPIRVYELDPAPPPSSRPPIPLGYVSD